MSAVSRQMKFMMCCALLVLLIVGCADIQHSTAGTTGNVCLARGGAGQRACLSQEYRCVMPYPDAGKSCSDSSECKGQCVVDLTDQCDASGKCVHAKVPEAGSEVGGVCQVDDDPCGSFMVVKRRHAQPIERLAAGSVVSSG
jgi:hypothetical protein